MSIIDVAAENLAIKARVSISSYCYLECKAHCCRNGYLLLNAKDVIVIQGIRKEIVKMIPVETKTDKNAFVLDLGAKNGGCPNLLNYKCTIHKNPLRPSTCQNFPLFIWENRTIMVTNACPAVKENKLYPYLAKFKKLGYKLVYIEGKD